MPLRNVIRSITLIVVISLIMAWLGQYILYRYNIAEAVCFTSDCQATTKSAIIGSLFLISLFSSIYLVFINHDLANSPGMEVSVLLSCLIVNFIYFNLDNTNAYLTLVPYNVLSVYFYYRVKKQLNKPFAVYPFIMQEIFLMLLLVCTYVYLDELFVTKRLDRDTIMYTGGEKMLGRIFDVLVWSIFSLHACYVFFKLVLKKTILRSISYTYHKGPLP
ncbi:MULTISPECIES: hypothetical protein [Niastella]|uniref:Vitamin K epoxide reductase domain-containing protein n=1 Tax=Niastella soli TaxID=2821487 RepID=A0ABS3YTE7_9BACT|nr:hypothetical protein [Niastella soli]MBO9201157.1 hypothetical protein [Niastella soli]